MGGVIRVSIHLFQELSMSTSLGPVACVLPKDLPTPWNALALFSPPCFSLGDS